jgi:uroporphyrinogen decarboxylase
MPDLQDLIRFVRGPVPEKPLPAIWDYFPCHAGAVGGVDNFLDYYFDADYKLALQMKLRDSIPGALILPGVFPDLGVIVEASAFGGQIVWFEKGAPFIFPAIRELRDIDSLKMPAAGLAGLMPLALRQREVMRRKLEAKGGEMEKWGFSMGPAEVTGLLLGYDKFYLALYDDPRRTANLLQMATEMIIAWLRRQESEYGGIDVLCLGEHVPHQVNPAQMKEFILPCLRAVYGAFPRAVKIYHNEGFHSDAHIALVLDFGADIWHFGSDVHPLGDFYSKTGDRIIPFGGVNPHGVMRHGTPQQVRRETRGVVEAARGHKLILSTGTGTTPEATLENQRAMVEAALEG